MKIKKYVLKNEENGYVNFDYYGNLLLKSNNYIAFSSLEIAMLYKLIIKNIYNEDYCVFDAPSDYPTIDSKLNYLVRV